MVRGSRSGVPGSVCLLVWVAAAGTLLDVPGTRGFGMRVGTCPWDMRTSIVVDVRTQAEWNNGHVRCATHTPYNNPSLVQKVLALTKNNKNAKIVTYCRSGHRAGVARGTLQQAGFTNVVNAGGWANWPKGCFCPAKPGPKCKDLSSKMVARRSGGQASSCADAKAKGFCESNKDHAASLCCKTCSAPPAGPKVAASCKVIKSKAECGCYAMCKFSKGKDKPAAVCMNAKGGDHMGGGGGTGGGGGERTVKMVRGVCGAAGGGGGGAGTSPPPPPPAGVEVDWNAQFQVVSKTKTVTKGTTLTFSWSGSHNVYRLASQAAYDSCDFTGATLVGSSSPATATVTTTAFFACKVGAHCSYGQKLEALVGVAPPGPGDSSGADPCAAVCPVGTCDSPTDMYKPACAACATCQGGGSMGPPSSS